MKTKLVFDLISLRAEQALIKCRLTFDFWVEKLPSVWDWGGGNFTKRPSGLVSWYSRKPWHLGILILRLKGISPQFSLLELSLQCNSRWRYSTQDTVKPFSKSICLRVEEGSNSQSSEVERRQGCFQGGILSFLKPRSVFLHGLTLWPAFYRWHFLLGLLKVLQCSSRQHQGSVDSTTLHNYLGQGQELWTNFTVATLLFSDNVTDF